MSRLSAFNFFWSCTFAGMVIVLIGCVKQPAIQLTNSMEPSIKKGESVQVNTAAYRYTHPNRWDIVAFNPPGKSEERWIFRVIGLPGDIVTFDENRLLVNSRQPSRPASVNGINYTLPSSGELVEFPYVVPSGSYFVLGDNPHNSFDSRYWGALKADRIIGKIEK